MLIKQTTIDKVNELNLVDVISKYVTLKKAGAQYMCNSPFVDEKTPSFSVSEAKGLWKCYSSGIGGNNPISFVMEHLSLTYPEAIKHIANQHGIPVEYEDTKEAKRYHEKIKKKQSLVPVMQSAVRKFQEAFWKLPADHPAKKEVFEKRQYTEELAKEYGIGYAPGHDYIYNLAVENGQKENAEKVGLISDKGDKWINRVVYPLLENNQAKIVAVGVAGRSLSDSKKYAKWMNPINSPLYQKDKYWYGLHIARQTIARERTAFVVEGYNDVIAFQRFGITNTVSPCGTAIATGQIKKLKKISERVVFCMDPDDAGVKSMLKYITEFLKNGFRTHVLLLPDGKDPDDYVRHIKAKTEEDLKHLKDQNQWQDGFSFLLQKELTEDPIENLRLAKKLVSLVNSIDDEAMKEIYLQWIAKETKATKTQIKSFSKETEVEEKKKKTNGYDPQHDYNLPDDVKTPIDLLLPTIQKYGMFQANNKIYMMRGDEAPYSFYPVSNFSIEIIQHMIDEQQAKKLISIKNTHNQQAVFDIPSEVINTPLAFENAVTNYGNYQWKGDRKDHQKLKFCLFDAMGTGRQIEVLGWQPEGFWVWNNLVITENGEEFEINDRGCFQYKEISYYIPSANSIYANNPYKYDPQKRFKVVSTNVSFNQICRLTCRVHGNHGMIGILFALASFFQDIIAKEMTGFPILFLYGPPGTGKDLLSEVIQSFWGKPQNPINLEGNSSTIKAKIRKTAQFCNSVAQFSEYKPGNPEVEGMMKAFWDRNGYERGTLESKISTESIPVLSSPIVTSNFTPDQDATITRFVWNNMDKSVYSEEDDLKYNELADIVKRGFSQVSNDIIKLRKNIENDFKQEYRRFKTYLKTLRPNANSRMVSNLSSLGAVFKILEKDVDFSFLYAEMVDVFADILDKQMAKLNTASILSKFWDCYLASLRGNATDILQYGRDFDSEGNKLIFQWTSTYNKIAKQWFVQYRENPPSKSVLSDQLQKANYWHDKVKSHRYSNDFVSSAFIINMDQHDLKDELIPNINYQKSKLEMTGSFDHQTPVTPINQENNEKTGEIPF